MTYVTSHQQTLRARWVWAPGTILLTILLTYGHLLAMASGILGSLYLLYITSDVEGEIHISDEKIVVARMDIAEMFVANWADVQIEQSGKHRFILRNGNDGSYVRVDPRMYAQPDRLRDALLKPPVFTEAAA